jgi:hypothetical protein
MNQEISLPPCYSKWHYDDTRRLITATMKITNDDVEDVLHWAFERGICAKIYIYSGVHGEPGGILQVQDEQFYKKDLFLIHDGKATLNDPRVTVVKKVFDNRPEAVLKERVTDPIRLVILAWCYSEGYM